MSLFLAAIGPMGQPETTAWFLFPGDPDRPVVVAPTLAEAMPELQDIAQGRSIHCEPQLAGNGLDPAPWGEPARSDFAVIALDIENPDTMARIEDAMLVGRFCQAFAALCDRVARGWPQDERLLALDIPGRGARFAMIVEGPGLVILDDTSRPDAEDLSALDGLAAVLGRGHPAVESAFGRAFGLSGIPQPFQLHAGDKRPVNEADLALLTEALTAASRLDPGAAEPGERRGNGLTAQIVPAG
ncbi:hypothetical protein [Paracoccus sp. KR1-242]|uniref:hypothetical protein n=1 Tax=Paracoccus sp. KR1-242 TaxID=3410028 RepID=UPI003C0A6A39